MSIIYIVSLCILIRLVKKEGEKKKGGRKVGLRHSWPKKKKNNAKKSHQNY